MNVDRTLHRSACRATPRPHQPQGQCRAPNDLPGRPIFSTIFAGDPCSVGQRGLPLFLDREDGRIVVDQGPQRCQGRDRAATGRQAVFTFAPGWLLRRPRRHRPIRQEFHHPLRGGRSAGPIVLHFWPGGSTARLPTWLVGADGGNSHVAPISFLSSPCSNASTTGAVGNPAAKAMLTDRKNRRPPCRPRVLEGTRPGDGRPAAAAMFISACTNSPPMAPAFPGGPTAAPEPARPVPAAHCSTNTTS